MIFKVGVAKIFGSKKWHVMHLAVVLARRRGVSEGDVPPSNVGAFLKM